MTITKERFGERALESSGRDLTDVCTNIHTDIHMVLQINRNCPSLFHRTSSPSGLLPNWKREEEREEEVTGKDNERREEESRAAQSSAEQRGAKQLEIEMKRSKAGKIERLSFCPI